MTVVVLHGIESTGKSTLAADLAKTLGVTWVEEYGREYCMEHGTDCSAEDLQAIAATHQSRLAAAAAGGRLVIADTDWLMTRAWHRMMLGREWTGPEYPLADLYLHLAPDVAWIDDGLRVHSAEAERRRFDGLCHEELVRSGVRWTSIAGDWQARRAAALAAIASLNVAGGGGCTP